MGLGNSSLVEQVSGSLQAPSSAIWGLREGSVVRDSLSGGQEIETRPTMRLVYTTVQLWPPPGCEWVSDCGR